MLPFPLPPAKLSGRRRPPPGGSRRPVRYPLAEVTAEPQFTDLSSPGRAFLAVLYRDVYVTWGELPFFLSHFILQPLFLLFVFVKVLGNLGYNTVVYEY